MKIDAVGVTTSDMQKSIEFYTLLGFDFSNIDPTEKHIEPITPEGSARLMIDSVDVIKDILGENPTPSNHSPFAIHYNSPDELNRVVEMLRKNNATIVKEPWDAFWGQRYAVVEDPYGYKIDLYADLQ